MPSQLIVTPKATNANSYGTLAEADTYFDNRLHASAWTDASDDDKQAALIWGASVLDTRVKFNGVKTTLGQSMQWPRSYAEDPDVTGIPPSQSFTLDHWYLDPDAIPTPIKWAQFEMAFALISKDTTIDAKTYGFNAVTVGPISLNVDTTIRNFVLPLPVRDLVSRYGVVIGSGGAQRKLMRA